jgi:hypothetical protein
MEQERVAGLGFWAKLDVVGEEQVRKNLINNIYGDHGPKRELVLEWLLIKERARALEVSAKSDAMEEDILSKDRSASIKVRNYRIIAIAAIIIAVIAAHEEIIWLISTLMPWLPK